MKVLRVAVSRRRRRFPLSQQAGEMSFICCPPLLACLLPEYIHSQLPFMSGGRPSIRDAPCFCDECHT